MASQILTVIKIGGEAAQHTRRLFGEWDQVRLVRSRSEYASEQWPIDVRRAADAWANMLHRHRHQPPIVFWAEYVDLWSYCPPQRFLDEDGLTQIMADDRELHCLNLPLAAGTLQKLRQLRKTGQWPEDRQFAAVTLEAVSAWDSLVNDAVLVYFRQVVAGSVEDHELIDSLKTVPAWLA